MIQTWRRYRRCQRWLRDYPAGWQAGCVLSMLLSVALYGCVAKPLDALVKRDGYQQALVGGEAFLHRTVFKSRAGEGINGQQLHVYIEGDGRPWWRLREVAEDPTPRHPIVLSLLPLDPAPVLYLGRPCYFATRDPACTPSWWTHKRYSEAVVASLNAALDIYAASYQSIRLIGFSGGGTLAMLIAARRDDVDAVVTIAGNLDIHGWAMHHGYSPLRGSLNPAEWALPATIRQLHLLAARDVQVPMQLSDAVIGPGDHISTIVYPDFDHRCCWRSVWPAALEGLGP